MVDRGAGAVDVGRGATFRALRLGFFRQRQADAVLVTGVADRADAALHDLRPTRPCLREHPVGRVYQVRFALLEIDRCPVQKHVSVRFDQTRQQRVIGEHGVRGVLSKSQVYPVRRRAVGANEMELLGIEDDVGVAERAGRHAVDQLTHAEPDRARSRLEREPPHCFVFVGLRDANRVAAHESAR